MKPATQPNSETNPPLEKAGRLRRQLWAALVFPLLWAGAGCTGEPVISDLINNRMEFRMMGTYESVNPREWQNVYRDNLVTWCDSASVSDPANCDPVDRTYYGAFDPRLDDVSQKDVGLYLDIGELRLSKGDYNQNFFLLNTAQKIKDFWEFFGRDRRVYCTDYYSTDAEEKDTCEKQGGKAALDDWFNGNGTVYPVTDVEAGTYTHLGVYFRRIVTTHHRFFNAGNTNEDGESGDYYFTMQADSDGEPATSDTSFDTYEIPGTDYMEFAQYMSGEDTLVTYPRILPHTYKTGVSRLDDLVVDDSNEPFVLEFRIFLKNLMMQHKYDLGNGELFFSSISYVGLSDWRRDHFPWGADGQYNGGNLISRGRIYYPGRVGKVEVTDNEDALAVDDTYDPGNGTYGTNPRGTAPGMWLTLEYADIEYDSLRYNRDKMPYVASYTEGAGTEITFPNIMPGSYHLYRTCDLVGAAPVSSIEQNAKIRVTDDGDLATVGGYLDLTVFGEEFRGIVFRGDSTEEAADDLMQKLRSLPWETSPRFNLAEDSQTGLTDNIRIRPRKRDYYIQNDFQGLGDDPANWVALANAKNVSIGQDEDGEDFVFKAPLLHTGPDGFPEEIRQCSQEPFTVEEGQTLDLGALAAGDCACDGSPYP